MLQCCQRYTALGAITVIGDLSLAIRWPELTTDQTPPG